MALKGMRVLIGMMALIAAACDSSEETKEVTQEQAIGFSASMSEATTRSGGLTGDVTRSGGGEFGIDNTALRASGFGVYCWYTGTRAFSAEAPNYSGNVLLMRNQKVTYDASLTHPWTYSPTKYWPLNADDKLTFRAYAPYVDYNLVEETNGSYATYTTGMPLLPVMVASTDYHNDTQHDPLWGTGVYQPTDPGYAAADAPKYGKHYTDWNFAKSNKGDVDWYFHHGMAKIVFWGLVNEQSPDDVINIKSIKVEHLYDKGLLDISSPSESATTKPWWYDCEGDMTVTLVGQDAVPANTDLSRYEINKSTWTQLTDNGLLIIPRNFGGGTTMKITVTFESRGREVSMTTEVNRNLQGNTVYTFKMNISNNSLTIRISAVDAAFTKVSEVEALWEVYNW